MAAETPAQGAMAADLAALLEERDPLRSRDAPSDIGLRLAALDGAADADRGVVARIRKAAGQYRRLLLGEIARDGDPAWLLAAAFPDRIAQRLESLAVFACPAAVGRSCRWPIRCRARSCWRSRGWR